MVHLLPLVLLVHVQADVFLHVQLIPLYQLALLLVQIAAYQVTLLYAIQVSIHAMTAHQEVFAQMVKQLPATRIVLYLPVQVEHLPVVYQVLPYVT